MTQQRIQDDSFEERLLARLRTEVAARGAAEEASASHHTRAPAWRRRAPRLALGSLAAVASVVAVLLAISASGDNTPAAFAVEAEPESPVSVEIRSLEDAEGLEEALGEAGIPASVNYLAAGTACREPRFQSVPWPDGDRVIVSGPASGEGPFLITISREAVGAGQTLVITASPSPDGPFEAQVKLAEGAVAPCEPVPA